jgi:tRNA pseudouridine38-40 synthase
MELPPTRELALIVEYDGAKYHGFQVQVGVPTIQGEIESALAKLTGERIRVIGAGRTDAGVHAKGQVISFKTASGLSLQILIKALNFYLMPYIAVKYGEEVEGGFSARRDAVSREYRYTILNRLAPSPLHRNYAYFVPVALNTEIMNEACQSLLGSHDFASFTGPMRGKKTIRSVYRAEVSREEDLVFFDVVADSFLSKQVRNTVGSLVRVGLGKLAVEEFKDILRVKKPGLAAPGAPAHGLCLMQVNYPEHKFGKRQIYENL